MRIGSLCSGYGGLDLGLQQVVGGEVAWHVENDPAPSKILARHWPHVPNYGDITTVDWTQVEPVEWLTAGYPCQPFSHAGKRKGTDDERHIWPHVAAAVRALRPRHVLLENVAGHVSMGFDVVLADLAALGFDAVWGVVRASDAGAPHGRARIFVVATDAASDQGRVSDRNYLPAEHADARGRDTDPSQRAGETGLLRDDPRPTGDVAADAGGGSLTGLAAAGDGLRLTTERGNGPTADAASDGRDERWPEPAGIVGGSDAAERGPVVAYADLAGGEALLRRPGAGEPRRLQPVERGDTDWGAYEPAIRRWEHITGRAAPRPTEPGRTGPRLAPLFVEWLMGLPEGHVTAVGLPRNAQLKALGNGVVPAQCALAVRTLLPLVDLAIAA